MKVLQDFYVGLSDTNTKQELTETSLLRFLEDIAGMHSEKVGYGASSIDKTKRTWILLSWKVRMFKRPKMNETVTVETWSRLIEKFYAYRDFKVYDTNKNLVAIATSKWIYIDIENGRIVKVTDEVSSCYESENVSVFDEKEFADDIKLKEPESEIINEIDFKITRNLFDINNHVHNIYYMDIAKEALPEDVYLNNEFNDFEIMYKKEIKASKETNNIVKVYYTKEDDKHFVSIKTDDVLHAIIRLY